MSRSPTPKPPTEGTFTDVSPGVTLRETATLGSEIYVDGAQSLTKMHEAALRAGLDDIVLDALRAMPGSTHQDYRQQLEEVWRQDDRIDGTPLDGALSHILATAAATMHSCDCDDEDNHVQEALRTLRQLGTGNVDNIPSPREDAYATAALIREAGEAIPTRSVEVHLGVEWAGRRADQRADVLDWLSDLWLTHDVSLVASRSAAARLVDSHRDAIPAHLTKACKQRCMPRGPTD
ncbi:hypothetical protein, partial [Halogeometricum borinquense]|uniref:hypothetical protein n=1 Tax=Halogeometricum borinquense TaxID=60847 RepID=UPI0013E9B864